MRSGTGPSARAVGLLFWEHQRAHLGVVEKKLRSYGQMSKAFANDVAQTSYIDELEALIDGFVAELPFEVGHPGFTIAIRSHRLDRAGVISGVDRSNITDFTAANEINITAVKFVFDTCAFRSEK